MTFQFLCPQGHLLEGDPAHAGQPCQCPTCGTGFIIPSPVAEGAAAPTGDETGFTGIQTTPDLGIGGQAPQAAAEEAIPEFGASAKDDPDRVVRIICPNGHELETPMDMVGTDAMCPECNAQFRLRYEDSLEYRQEREEERARREAEWARKALRFSIGLAIFVAMVIVGLLLWSTTH